jgi:hypothetical protein
MKRARHDLRGSVQNSNLNDSKLLSGTKETSQDKSLCQKVRKEHDLGINIRQKKRHGYGWHHTGKEA